MKCRTVGLVLVCLLLNACTYNGVIRDDFYQSDERNAPKVKKTVGIAQSKKIKDYAFEFSSGGYSVDIKPHPGVTKALAQELSTIFDKVVILDGTTCKICDLIVTYELGWKNLYANSFSGDFAFAIGIMVTYKDKNGSTVSQMKSKDSFVYTLPGSVKPLGALTGATLFLLSPVTIPVTTQIIGGHAADLLERSFAGMISEIGEQSSIEGALKDTASKTTGIDPAPVASKYDAFLRAVVRIQNTDSRGSGFFVTDTGYIVTNKHVVGSDKKVSITLKNGKTLFGNVISTYDKQDLAIVKVDGRNYNWLALEETSETPVGDEVVAIGAPLNLPWSVTKGIVSAYRIQNGDVALIQTDTPITHGNSGGPLISVATGKVVGVNTSGQEHGSLGLNFAVSSKEVVKILSQLPK